MSLSEGTGGSSSLEAVALGEVLAFFGMVGDYAAGRAPEEGERVACLASAMAKVAGLSQDETDALYFAARLRNAGALANPAFAKAEALTPRDAMRSRWDVPAQGARMCERIPALPQAVPEIVRWQAECWDGTGYPDQLRWSGIPRAAQLLHLAAAYASSPDPEEALSAIGMESGRSFAPEHVRTFIMWFHTFGGEIEIAAPPYRALNADETAIPHILNLLSERIDAHNGTPGRGTRIARRCEELAASLQYGEETARPAALAALLFGIGELHEAGTEAERFDPLGRLGIESRGAHALAAARLIGQCPYLRKIAPIVRARAEWYDGTGKPDRLRHGAIPPAAELLAVAIAYDGIDEAYRSHIATDRTLPLVRLETAAGTQFDPDIVRVLGEIVKAQV